MWRKYWGEVRWLALYAAGTLIVLTWAGVGNPAAYRSPPFPEQAFVNLNRGYLHVGLPMVIIGWAVLLGIGGLGHERNGGTALFTLSLPFTRRSVMTGRFLAGAATLLVLSFAAELAVGGVAAVEGFGGQFTVTQAVAAAGCLTAGGVAIYTFSFLTANVTAHTIRTVATVVTILVAIQLGAGSPDARPDLHSAAWWLRPVNFLRLMGAGDYFETGHIPWLGLLIAVGFTLAFLEVAIRWVERFDF